MPRLDLLRDLDAEAKKPKAPETRPPKPPKAEGDGTGRRAWVVLLLLAILLAAGAAGLRRAGERWVGGHFEAPVKETSDGDVGGSWPQGEGGVRVR